MIETETAAQASWTFTASSPVNVDIEAICRECAYQANPPEVFLVTSKSSGNALLGVSLEFLERAQQLSCPGLPFVGAAFGPDWGFARVEFGSREDGLMEFRLLPGPFLIEDHDSYGYRLCPLEHHEVTKGTAQLAHIRTQLATTTQQHAMNSNLMITVTLL
jgi:hypothetical protein